MAASKRVKIFPLCVNIGYAVFITILLFIQSLPEAKANKLLDAETETLNKIFAPGKYDKRIRPPGVNDTGSTVVNVNLLVRSIDSISDVDMEFSIQITFRQQWRDERLAFNSLGRINYLTLTDADLLWMPDLFFRTEKEAYFHNLMQPNRYIRIYPVGDVLYSARLSLTLSCPMNLKFFPHDLQLCPVTMASYGWTTKELILAWKSEDPVQMTKYLHLPNFKFKSFSTDYCNSRTTTGEYSCLLLKMLFRRELKYYLLQVYIPCCMLVIASWISFWLDHNAVTARIALGVTILLTMSIQISRLNASLPTVSYTKAIDVWTGVCLTFVFAALVEFAIVNYYTRRETLRNATKKEKDEPPNLPDNVEEESSALPMTQICSKEDEDVEAESKEKPLQHQKKNFLRTLLSKLPAGHKCIDVISRIGFPLFFVFFIIIYWGSFVSNEEE